MRILLLCDDYWHPGNIPDEGIAPLKEKGFQIDVIYNAADFKKETLTDYGVVIMSKSDEVSREDKSSWKTDEVQKAFVDYVENGGGLLATHSGIVAGENTGKLDSLLGCKFEFHPVAGDVTVQPVKPHPITDGVGIFRETDEHYRIKILTGDVDILIASYSPAKGDSSEGDTEWIGAAGLIRTQGRGRVCVLTPGHNLPVWHNPQFQKTLENAVNWCAGKLL